MRLAATLLACGLALSACTEPVLVATTVPQPVVAPPPVTPDGRSKGRMFVEVVERVEPVAERICRQATVGRNCDYLIVVDDRPGQPPNAFQTVDELGRPIIAFTLSLIAETRNADEIAFVLAHEAAHHIAGHLEKSQQTALAGAIVFGELASIFGAGETGVAEAQRLGAAVGVRTYSKGFELEADALGTRIAAAAGFDPVRGAEFFFRLPDPENVFLSTHPANSDRVRVVRETAANL